MTEKRERPKLESRLLVEMKRFPRQDSEKRTPKIVQLLALSDGGYWLSASSDLGRIVIKMSRMEALDFATAIMQTVEY